MVAPASRVKRGPLLFLESLERYAISHSLSERFCRNCGMPLVHSETPEEAPATEAA